MSTVQVIQFCLLSLFFMVIAVYLCAGLLGGNDYAKSIKPFLEFSVSYLFVMGVILFLPPERDVLKQLLWGSHGYEAIGTLSVLFMLFYSITLIARNALEKTAEYIKHRNKNYLVVKEDGYFAVGGNDKDKRYLSVAVNHMELVSRAKRIFLAEVTPQDGSIVSAIRRTKEECLSGGYDLVVVNTTGLGCGLKARLKKELKEIPVIAGCPTGPRTETHIVPVS